MSTPDAINAVKTISSDLLGSDDYDKLAAYFTELEQILKAIKPFAKPRSLSICGAGRQATPGVADVGDGITIHLRKLRRIHVDKEKRIVSVGAGELMGVVNKKAAAAGLGVVGGLAYFAYSQGFVCDNVASYEVLLAEGQMVNANADTNRDL
ncbi:hypothetical protein NPX13_g6614 [Xylaria arbuscula]|uniref:FAD linked oxidase N-terminal domain-containing protein n=1 Tax=Xylaria arbuscula TaxID=114810 RepID=A0A9W8TLZ4_9PEZI|nr:hypothetical protein NPX13_g6614 [Xylaria arbuscula]